VVGGVAMAVRFAAQAQADPSDDAFIDSLSNPDAAHRPGRRRRAWSIGVSDAGAARTDRGGTPQPRSPSRGHVMARHHVHRAAITAFCPGAVTAIGNGNADTARLFGSEPTTSHAPLSRPWQAVKDGPFGDPTGSAGTAP